MNIKKISIVLIVLVALVASLNMICADDTDINIANGVLTIEHSTFKIPSGFSENQALRHTDIETKFMDKIPAEAKQLVLVNGNQNITITYYDLRNDQSFNLDPSGTTVLKNISGHQGLFQKLADGSYGFIMTAPGDDRDNAIQIIAPSEQLIADMLK